MGARPADGHQGARDRDHLPLASRHCADGLAAALGEAGKKAVHRFEPARQRFMRRRREANLQIFGDGQARKHIGPLRDIADAEPRHLARAQA
jgi:hypothetical protein